MSNGRGGLLRASFSSAYSLIALQFFSRLLTFLLNQASFHMVSPRAFGMAAIQFELVLTTILFLSREGVRNALLRTKPLEGRASSDTSNLTLLPLLLGLPLTVATTYLYRYYASDDTRSQPYFDRAISVYALSAIIELISEPMHNRAMSELRTDIRVRAEGSGILGKTIVVFLILLYDSRSGGPQGQLALLAFAVGQLAYGTILLAVYVAYYRSFPLWCKCLGAFPWIRVHHPAHPPQQLLRLSVTMTLQSILKHILTEGDKLILSWLSPLEDQGGYAVAANYGSLVARIAFQPIEETLRLAFSKLHTDSAPSPESPIKSRRMDGDVPRQIANSLIHLLAIQFSFSIIFLVFGTAYVPIALHVILPPQYLTTSAPNVLAAWVWYIPVLAINGGLEAFVTSVATPQDLNAQSGWMTGFSMIYISTALTLYRLGLGDVSLVYANIANLAIRIAYCLWFVTSYFRVRRSSGLLVWKNVAPRWEVLTALVSSKMVIRFSESALNIPGIIAVHKRSALWDIHVVMHILLGGTLLALCSGVWWIFSGQLLTLTPHSKIE